MKSPSDKRHITRIIILQRLFERYFRTGDIAKTIENEFTNDALTQIDDEEELKYDKKLADKLFKGTIATTTKTDHIISELAPEWPLEQINKVDLQILRMAIYEGFISKLTPERVVIDEAVELAKEFGGQPSGKFVNGVLGTLLKSKNKYEKILNESK